MINSRSLLLVVLGVGAAGLACSDNAGEDSPDSTSGSDGTSDDTASQTEQASDSDSDTYTVASSEQVRTFVGGKDAILAWVDAGGRVKLLDLSQDSPEPVLLSDETSCVNPLLSPDGTRVIYSRGQANGPKQIFLRDRRGGEPVFVASGDVGYFASTGGVEYVVYSDWSEKASNGADGKTYRRPLTVGTTTLAGPAEEWHARAMDAGPNRDLSWLGQVYDNMYAFDVSSDAEYPTDKFFLQDGTAATHQTCNGSMAPDATARMMVLVIPHDWVRVFSYISAKDRFEETSRFELPVGLVEWEFPEWSTAPGYFTAVLRAADRKNRLFVGKVEEGDVVPELIEVVGSGEGASYGHLWIGQ